VSIRHAVLLAGLVLTLPVFADGDDRSGWGLGVVVTDMADARPGDTPFPEGPVPLHAAPGGEPVGQVFRDPRQWALRVQRAGESQDRAAVDRDLREVGYEITVLTVFAARDGFVRVLRETLPGGAWLSREALARHGFEYVPWVEFLRRHRDGGLHPARGLTLTLHEGPGDAHPVHTRLHGHLDDLTPTGRRDGAWLEFDAVRYAVHPCASGAARITGRWRGWARAVDTAGAPNLWYPTRGC
jgi:hypothetical protein